MLLLHRYLENIYIILSRGTASITIINKVKVYSLVIQTMLLFILKNRETIIRHETV